MICQTGKIGYANKGKAVRARAVVGVLRGHRRLSAYRCSTCNQYHLGRRRDRETLEAVWRKLRMAG